MNSFKILKNDLSEKVHASLTVDVDGNYTLAELAGLQPEIIDGF